MHAENVRGVTKDTIKIGFILDLTNETLVDALETIKNLETGISGPVTFNPDKHKATDYCRLFKADLNKKLLVPVGGWRRPGY